MTSQLHLQQELSQEQQVVQLPLVAMTVVKLRQVQMLYLMIVQHKVEVTHLQMLQINTRAKQNLFLEKLMN